MDEKKYTCARDYQLFGPGPKRILSLDGGGVRGAITVAFLERIESILSERAGQPIRLGDHFHLVGGTSTGSVIAGAIALGYRAAQ
jgi:patatin-like phospholipase/acyl hydrolase